MSKKDKKSKISIDFQFGIDGIIPATQESFKRDGTVDFTRRAEEKASIVVFNKKVSDVLVKQSWQLQQFPTNNEVFVFILQYFIAEKEYSGRDIDNMAKTILDLLKKRFYSNDGQVKTLLINKRIDKINIPRNFAYIAIKELKKGQEMNFLKKSIDRSVNFYRELYKV